MNQNHVRCAAVCAAFFVVSPALAQARNEKALVEQIHELRREIETLKSALDSESLAADRAGVTVNNADASADQGGGLDQAQEHAADITQVLSELRGAIEELTSAIRSRSSGDSPFDDPPEGATDRAEREAERRRKEALKRVNAAHAKARRERDHFRLGAFDRMVKLARQKEPPAKQIDQCREFIIAGHTDKCENLMKRW